MIRPSDWFIHSDRHQYFMQTFTVIIPRRAFCLTEKKAEPYIMVNIIIFYVDPKFMSGQ